MENGIITALRSRANGTKKIFILPTHRVCVGKMGFYSNMMLFLVFSGILYVTHTLLNGILF